ncbi:MAG: peroxiredoxin [Acidimicrobiales bacterium]|nr:peroxiredoxin [Acidimicrobiales bacterium]MCB1246638.1 peroxiredoxin [Acidimicrobiia bacterium]
MLDVGERAPDFTLLDQQGKNQSLGDQLTLLYWYPKADTPGCVAQAQGLRDHIEVFDGFGCRVLGASFDPVEDLRAFADKYDLGFPLLSDLDRKVGVAYGVAGEDGTAAYANRIAYLISPQRQILATYVVDNPEMFAERVLDDLEEGLVDG